MVSEGVDIPRLAVGVYATSVSTALFFAQAVGRFVRARQRGETASVFLPSVPVLLSYAAELEAERDHILRHPSPVRPTRRTCSPRRSGSAIPRTRSTSRPSRPSTRPRTSTGCCTTAGSSAPPRRPGSPEEEDFLGLPGLLEPDQVRTLLRKRQDAQVAARSRDRRTARPARLTAPLTAPRLPRQPRPPHPPPASRPPRSTRPPHRPQPPHQPRRPLPPHPR